MNSLDILVADDEVGIRELLTDILTMHGHKVTSVENGTEVLRVLSSEHVDAVYLDIRMPNGDGLSTLKNIRKLWPSIPVIMITGCGQRELIDETMELGAYICLSKPFGIGDVIGMLEVLQIA